MASKRLRINPAYPDIDLDKTYVTVYEEECQVYDGEQLVDLLSSNSVSINADIYEVSKSFRVGYVLKLVEVI